MIKLFVINAFRNLWRSKINTLINLLSLSIGLTVFAFAFVYVKKEVSYNKGWFEADRIHRLLLDQNDVPGLSNGTYSVFDPVVYSGLPDYFSTEFNAVSRVATQGLRLANEENSFFRLAHFVDPEFSDVFRLEVVAGDLNRALNEPGFIALEESFSESMGDKARLGNRITLEAPGNESAVEFEVGAIYRLPEKISPAVNFTQLLPINDYVQQLFTQPGGNAFVPWEQNIQIWVTLVPGLSTEAFNAMQSDFLNTEITAFNSVLEPGDKLSDHLNYIWQPISEMYLNPVINDLSAGQSGNADRVVTIAVVGLLVLLVGCSNSISLSLASILERRKDTGIHKSAGALPGDIMKQYLAESVLQVTLAFIVMTLVLLFMKPFIALLSPATFTTDSFEFGLDEFLLLALISLVIGLINGLYPALVLSRVRPQTALRPDSAKSNGQGLNIRGLLVAGQFFLASVLLITTAALYTQLAVTRNQPMGMTVENLYLVNTGFMESAETFIRALEQQPGIDKALPMFSRPNMNTPNSGEDATLIRKDGGVITDIKAESMAISLDSGFLDMFGIPLLAGRYYDAERDAEASNLNGIDVRNIPSGKELRSLVNRSATRQLGFDSPESAVEQLIYSQIASVDENGETFFIEIPIRIIGVIEDSMFSSFSRRPGPQIYERINFVQLVVVKYQDILENSILETIEEVAKDFPQIQIAGGEFLEDSVKNAFHQERNESRLLLICGAMALLLSCIGLYGLAAFSMERNTKEVGIRKALGAEVPNIMGLYLWRFAKPVLLASLLACPVAIYFVLQWIEQFPYQLEKAWLLPLCLGASGTVLVIALMTVSLITARAASRKPVISLRYE